MNKSARKEIRKKSGAWKRYCLTKSYNKYLDYVKARNRATSKLKAVKKEFEKKLASECKVNPKAFYKYANFKSKANHRVIRLKNKDGKIQLSDKDNAETLNNYFISVFEKENDCPELIINESTELLWEETPNDPFIYKGKVASGSLDDVELTLEEVEEMLSKIDPTKSNSPECIHPRIIKECAVTLAPALHYIYQMSLKTGSVPPQWKKGTVTPLHKGGTRHSEKNYRPITITSILCRLLEKIVKKSMIKHLDDEDYISDDQHGFRTQRSCLSNILLNLEEITNLLDQGNAVDQFYLDLQKAFDKVPHKRLIYKLKKAGISGTLLSWIESFLSFREQRVKVNGSYSKWQSVLSGVPQGSVLGPVLFIIFINDLPDNISTSSCKIFADDTKLYRAVNNLKDVKETQADLDRIQNWCKYWKLSFNTDKCHILHFGSKNYCHYYHLNGRLITPVNEEKDLGVVVSKDLKADKNIIHCITKANKMLGMIKRTFSHLDRTMLVQLFKVYVRPHLEYCQQACSPHYEKDIEKLEKVQRRATKLIPCLEGLTYDERLKDLKLYSLEDRRKRGDLILMYRIMTNDIKIDRNKLFSIKDYQRLRGHDMKVHHTRVSKLDIRHNFFTQRVITPWNSLPGHVINSKTVKQFKDSYDQWRGLV